MCLQCLRLLLNEIQALRDTNDIVNTRVMDCANRCSYNVTKTVGVGHKYLDQKVVLHQTT